MNREEVTLLLKAILADIISDLHHRAYYTTGSESASITEVANAIDNVSIEYHVSQIDEYVREADEDSS